MPNTPLPVFDLEVVLDDRPAVKRRLRMSSGASLDRLHRVICVALSWPTSPRYVVEYAGLRVECQLGEGATLRLRQVLIDLGSSLGWGYEDGQLWNATVTLVARHSPHAHLVTPSCLDAVGGDPRVDADPWEHLEENLPAPSCEAINAVLQTLRS